MSDTHEVRIAWRWLDGGDWFMSHQPIRATPENIRIYQAIASKANEDAQLMDGGADHEYEVQIRELMPWGPLSDDHLSAPAVTASPAPLSITG